MPKVRLPVRVTWRGDRSLHEGIKAKHSPWARRRSSPSARWPRRRQPKHWSSPTRRREAATPCCPCSHKTESHLKVLTVQERDVELKASSRDRETALRARRGEKFLRFVKREKNLCSHSPYCKQPVHQDDGLWERITDESWEEIQECQKGALRSFGEEIQTQTFNIYNINEAVMQTQKYVLLLRLNKQAALRGKLSSRRLFEAGKVAGSATYKQSKTAWNCVVL